MLPAGSNLSVEKLPLLNPRLPEIPASGDGPWPLDLRRFKISGWSSCPQGKNCIYWTPIVGHPQTGLLTDVLSLNVQNTSLILIDILPVRKLRLREMKTSCASWGWNAGLTLPQVREFATDYIAVFKGWSYSVVVLLFNCLAKRKNTVFNSPLSPSHASLPPAPFLLQWRAACFASLPLSQACSPKHSPDRIHLLFTS